ncbi:MAG: AEC family transporter [Planctomycetia bacterium]|nr:AEC family transporter [Planctomycetia bacterium]
MNLYSSSFKIPVLRPTLFTRPPMYISVFNATILIFSLLILGGFLRWIRCLAPESDKSLMSLSINVLYPCLIFDKISQTDILSHLQSFGMAPVLGIASIVVFALILSMFIRLPSALTGLINSDERRMFLASSALYNYGYLPVPILMFLYPDEHEIMSCLFVFTLGVEFAVWAIIVPILAGGFHRGWWKNMISTPFVTIFLALALNCVGGVAFIPTTVAKTIEWLGLAQLTIPLIVIGAVMFDQLRGGLVQFGALRTWQVVSWTLVFRCVVFPLLMILATRFLGGNPALQKILVIQAAMPTAMMLVMFSRIYGGSTSVAVQSILSTNMFSLVSTVFWISFGMWGLKQPWW